MTTPSWHPAWPLPLAVRRDAELAEALALADFAAGRASTSDRERLRECLLAGALLAADGVGADHAELLRRAAELDDPAAVAEGLQVLAAQRAIVSWGRLRRAHAEAQALGVVRWR